MKTNITTNDLKNMCRCILGNKTGVVGYTVLEYCKMHADLQRQALTTAIEEVGNELIGEDEQGAYDEPFPAGDDYIEQTDRNNLRAEQRKKLSQILKIKEEL